jgi:wobble nucleotide-excising tRNase
MIRRINKLKNVGRFADLKSQGGTQNEFAKMNVIYAPNSGGKTTLCDVFRSLGTGKPDFILGRKRFGAKSGIEIEILFHGSPSPKSVMSGNGWQSEPAGGNPPRILVYDDRFVADNVFIGQFVAVEQRRNVYGLALGTQAHVLKAQVDIAEQDLTSATNALNTARAALMPLIPAGFNIDTFQGITKDEAIDQHIKEVTDELETAKRTKANADAIRQRKPLNIITPPTIPSGLTIALETTLDDAALQAEAKIREHLHRHSHGLGLEWLGQGHKGQSGTACPHCGQEMEGLEILQAYRVFFSGVLQAQQAELNRILNEAQQNFGETAQQRWEQFLMSHYVEKEWWKDAGGKSFNLPDCYAFDTLRKAMQDVYDAIFASVKRKQAQPTVQVILDGMESSAFATWDSMTALLNDYMAGIARINAGIVDWQRAVVAFNTAPIEGRIAAMQIQKKRHEDSVINAYAAFHAAVANKSEKERAKVTANNALREQSNQVLAEYGDRINALLDRFGVNFRIVSNGVNFFGGPPAGELAVEILGTRVSTTPEDARNPLLPSLANTLSGGDRSALGVAFFVAVAERDANIGDTIVVFDDPFHSQDRSRRRRTIECIHRVALASHQCFILSHELDFAQEAARITSVPVHTFTLNPMTDHSVLEAGNLPPLPGRAYEHDYKKLADFLATPAEFSAQLKDVARCIRQTLEGYLRTKFPRSWQETDWLGEMIRKIREAQPGNVLQLAAHLVTALTEVNDWGKRYYHAENDGSDAGEVDPRELKDYVEQTIEIISR